MTQDSSPGGTEDPQSLNRYAYARDNPMKFVEKNGHFIGLPLHTDYDLPKGAIVTTTPEYINGVFTVTTSEQYSGYSTVWKSTFQTAVSTSGVITQSGSTIVVSVSPTGRISIDQTITQITTTSISTGSPIKGSASYPSRDIGSAFSGQNGAWIVTGLAIAGVGIAAVAAPPVAILLIPGAIGTFLYTALNGQNAKPEDAAGAWLEFEEKALSGFESGRPPIFFP